MALVTCPECGKEVSDQTKNCIHCGYQIVSDQEETAQKPQPVEVTAINIGDPKKKKKVLTGVISALIVVAVVIAGVFIYQADQRSKAEAAAAEARAAYIDNLSTLKLLALSGGVDAEGLCNLTRSVWYNTIYEERDSKTDKYTLSSYGWFHDSFNDSIAALYDDTTTKNTVNGIKDNQTAVAEIMKTLQNPTEEFKTCYETANSLYEVYRSFTNLAISPTGNLGSYTDSFSEYDTAFMKYYDMLSTQIPEE